MRNFTNLNCALALAALTMTTLYSCKKDDNSTPKTTPVNVATTSGNITIATGSTNPKDSLVLMNLCPAGPLPDTVAASSLPLTVSTYLTLNYSGYTFRKAFKVVINGALDSYVVVFGYNKKPIAIKFTTLGTFTAVLEQREPADLSGPGYHQGGRFENRNGKCPDTLVVTALPAPIKTYIKTNYTNDTLLHAVVNKDTTYIVLSANRALYATSFSSKGVFVTRVQLNATVSKHISIVAAALPASVIPYLNKSYPGSVIHKIFREAIKKGVVIDKYLVFLDDNGTRYMLQFSSAGVFVKATIIK